MIKDNLFGDRQFYRRTFAVVLPMIIQNTLSNIVSLLDNIMVGQVGTLPMSAVAIDNQMLFVFYITIFGAVAGAGIYGAQFFGSGDFEGVRNTLKFKFLMSILFTAAVGTVFFLYGTRLAELYISADTAAGDRMATLTYAKQYMSVMILGLFPFAITQCYAGTLRESGKTMLPMKAGIVAMATNFVLNSLLIFGLFGFPKLGVLGAAIATVISRFVEMFVVIFFSHRDRINYPFLKGLFDRISIPKELAVKIMGKSLPLLCNELLWSLGQAFLLQCYSVRGLPIIAAVNITNTVSQIFYEVYLSLGNATTILVGHELGANHLKEARRTAYRMMMLSVMGSVLTGAVLALCSPYIPLMYNTEENIRLMATEFILVVSCCMPIFGFAAAAYFTMRSGGRTFITFLSDSFYTWIVPVPAAWLLANRTALPILTVFLIVNLLDFIKCIIGFSLVRTKIWIKNLVAAE